MTFPAFQHYIGIHYSGAEVPDSSLRTLRIYEATPSTPPAEIPPPPGPKKYWTRRSIASWLEKRLFQDEPTIVGIAHAFSFPLRYFEVHHIEPDWSVFLEDFRKHWPTDSPHTYVDFVLNGTCGNADARSGHPRWRRITEERIGAKSVFNWDVPKSISKATHAGLPWLHSIRTAVGEKVHFWPFDGWTVSEGRSTVVEVHPPLWTPSYPQESRTSHQHAAYATAAWLRDADADNRLQHCLEPTLKPYELRIGQLEGWILGAEQSPLVPPIDTGGRGGESVLNE